MAGLQVLAAAAIAGAILFLLYRYIQYGERSARETGTSRQPGAAGDETAGLGEHGVATGSPGAAGDETAGLGEYGVETGSPDETEIEAAELSEYGVETGSLGETETEAAGQSEKGQLPATVRVRLLTDGFAEGFHDRVEVTSESPFRVMLDDRQVKSGKRYAVSASSLDEGQVLQIAQKEDGRLTVESLERACGHPQYAGTLWLYRVEEGIVLINELPLEEYLCSVVASEMPSDYPEEAQKAQAVCARTYAYNCIRNARGTDPSEDALNGTQAISGNMQTDDPGEIQGVFRGDTQEIRLADTQGAMQQGRYEKPAADLDDSVNAQVYNNYQATEQSRRAVEATEGEILPLDEVQYYSTSCQSEHREDLDSDEAFRDFLQQEPDAGAEYDSPWLRWETELSSQEILKGLASRYGWQADWIDEIRVAGRAGNGQVTELELRCGDALKRVSGEYAIRQLLSPGQAALRLRDGEEQAGLQLLPSAFFWLEPGRGTAGRDSAGNEGNQSGADAQTADASILSVVIHGGGYGHGNGMSQCGAAALAEKGLDYREILEYYYQCGVEAFA